MQTPRDDKKTCPLCRGKKVITIKAAGGTPREVPCRACAGTGVGGYLTK